MQVGHLARPRRPQLGPGQPVQELVHQRLLLLGELGQLLGCDVQHGVAEMRGLLPGLRLPRFGLQPAHQVLEVPFGQHAAEQIGGRRQLRVFRHIRPGGEHGGGLPGPLPAGAAAGLLDQAVLGQLPKVERAAGRALAQQLAGPGRGQRPFPAQQPDQREPDRMGERPECPWIGEPLHRAARLVSHRCKDSFPKCSLESYLCKGAGDCLGGVAPMAVPQPELDSDPEDDDDDRRDPQRRQ